MSNFPKSSGSSGGKGAFIGGLASLGTPANPYKVWTPATVLPSVAKSVVASLPETTLADSTDSFLNDATKFSAEVTTEFDPLMSFLCNFSDPTCNLSSNGTSDEVNYGYWHLALLIFPFFTVFGNVLVILSVYRERSLRTVTNYFICSLAVADIMVAVLVMPPAVYMEVVQSWLLSDQLCDAWVAADVMACTASILNLTAISVDRFIAVTQPIKYSKHKNSNRIYVMLALTWVISVAIAAPIALGVNYSHLRDIGDCAFFNSDFLIYSSMGSFYIPSVIMVFLYWRIYRVLAIRARRSLAHKKAKSVRCQPLSTVIENTATTTMRKSEPTAKTGLSAMDNGKVTTYNATKGYNQLSAPAVDDTSVTKASTNTDSQYDPDDEDGNEDDSVPKSPGSDVEMGNENKGGELIMNPVAAEHERLENDGKLTCVTTAGVEVETQFAGTSTPNDGSLSPAKDKGLSPFRKKDKKSAHRFNFHLRTSRKRKEKSSSRRESKATKTLAIVLGVFLFCWWPFFTANIINAFCLRYELSEMNICTIPMWLFSFFVWLGYINSFLNPVIYTIFNPEFRKAFKKILTQKRR